MKQAKMFCYMMVFTFLMLACKKSDIIDRSQPTLFTNLRTDSLKSDTTFNNITLFAFKIDGWQAYPYFTDTPEDDSFFNSWSPYIADTVYKRFKRVNIKNTDGSIVAAPLFITVDANSSGFLFQPGETLMAGNKILLWWIQKVDGTRPTADSCFLSY